jgi:hypothetical protein
MIFKLYWLTKTSCASLCVFSCTNRLLLFIWGLVFCWKLHIFSIVVTFLYVVSLLIYTNYNPLSLWFSYYLMFDSNIRCLNYHLLCAFISINMCIIKLSFLKNIFTDTIIHLRWKSFYIILNIQWFCDSFKFLLFCKKRYQFGVTIG